MRRIKVDKNTSDTLRKEAIKFIVKYGDGHITKKAINWLRKTPFSSFQFSNGDLLHAFLDGKKIVGVIAIARYGLDQAIIVIDPKVRKKGIAFDLTTGVLEDINRVYVKVANDNIPSLKLCFSAGMEAFDLIKGPTGKPTLILGLGSWSQDEWRVNQSKK